MLGGGTFTEQNEILPGSYINIISAARAAESSERGTVTMPFILDWGQPGKVFKVTVEDFGKRSMELFGYSQDHKKLQSMREVFKNANILYAYRLINNGVAATSKMAVARYPGIRGNDIRIAIAANIDDADKKDVITYLGDIKVDKQTVAAAADLKDNNFIVFNKDETLENTPNEKLEGGTNGDAITGTEYQGYLDAMESYSFTTMGTTATDEAVKALFASYTKRMSEEVGAKFQCVLFRYPADYEGVISLQNKVLDIGMEESALIPWLLGAEGGCALNRSVTNKTYNGEYSVDTALTQKELEESLAEGRLVFHSVGNETRVLKDVNTLVTYTETKNAGFSSNETIRVMYQIASDIAYLFNSKYLGKIPNDDSGRLSLWNSIVNYHQKLERMQAIMDFNANDVTVGPGEKINSVVVTDYITIMKTMEQLYMTVVVQ